MLCERKRLLTRKVALPGKVEVIMDISMIEAFLALADSLNFTKSAEHLYISQPAFSRKISRLEDEFGCKFFTRNKRTVELTEYGRAFYPQAQDIYAAYAKWSIDLKQLKGRKSGHLRIGYLQDLPHRLFPKAVKQFQSDFDQIELTFTDCSMTDIVNRLVSNEIDIGFSLSGDVTKHEKISFIHLLIIPMCVALPDNHPLAAKESLSIKDLEHESFISSTLDGYGPGTRYMINLCNMAGFEPNISAISSFVPSMLILVKSGIGVTIVANTARQFTPEGVKLIPLSERGEIASTNLMLLWKTSNNNPAIPAFIDVCRSLVAEVIEESGDDIACPIEGVK
jgi:DNA-binding transcriptional LysR family regulator